MLANSRSSRQEWVLSHLTLKAKATTRLVQPLSATNYNHEFHCVRIRTLSVRIQSQIKTLSFPFQGLGVRFGREQAQSQPSQRFRVSSDGGDGIGWPPELEAVTASFGPVQWQGERTENDGMNTLRSHAFDRRGVLAL